MCNFWSIYSLTWCLSNSSLMSITHNLIRVLRSRWFMYLGIKLRCSEWQFQSHFPWCKFPRLLINRESELNRNSKAKSLKESTFTFLDICTVHSGNHETLHANSTVWGPKSITLSQQHFKTCASFRPRLEAMLAANGDHFESCDVQEGEKEFLQINLSVITTHGDLQADLDAVERV